MKSQVSSRWRRGVAGALAVVLVAGCGGGGDGVTARSWQAVYGGAGARPALHPRCRGHDMAPVPDTSLRSSAR